MGWSTKSFVFFRINLCILSYTQICFQHDAFARDRLMHKALFMGHSMRLELTRVCSLNGFQFVMFFFFMNVGPSFFLECVSLLYFTLHLLFRFDTLFMCLCVFIGVASNFTNSIFLCSRVNLCLGIIVYVYMFLSICVCVRFMFY